MTDLDVSQIEVGRQKWEFTLYIKTRQVKLDLKDGTVWLHKIVYVDNGQHCKVEASGNLVRGHSVMMMARSQNFNVNNCPQWEQCPQIILDIIRMHGFGRTEL